MKTVLVVLLALTMTGCGWMDRKIASIGGRAAETCIDGVVYLQFTSGATVKYNTDGTIALCGD